MSVEPFVAENKLLGWEACNLFKLFIENWDTPGFAEIYQSGFRVFLYREDTAAQLASWRRACETGWWVAEVKGHPLPFPDDAEQQIQLAHERFLPDCDLAISHETLIDRWDETISRILTLAGWEDVKIPMARAKLPT